MGHHRKIFESSPRYGGYIMRSERLEITKKQLLMVVAANTPPRKEMVTVEELKDSIHAPDLLPNIPVLVC